jgi:hypothetical protein
MGPSLYFGTDLPTGKISLIHIGTRQPLFDRALNVEFWGIDRQ